MKHYSTILFDLDGTLTDPQVGITKSVQYALGRMGIEEPALEKLIHFIGPPLAASFRESYSMDQEQSVQAVQYYREYFSQTGIYENAVYAGIPELLEKLWQLPPPSPIFLRIGYCSILRWRILLSLSLAATWMDQGWKKPKSLSMP